MKEFSSLASLACVIEKRALARIGIDGIDGVGKTPLAKELASKLGYECLSLDDYLNKNRGGFVDHLNYSELRADIRAHKKFVIEGVCLLQVLDKLQERVDLHVYLKRLHFGIWADERTCEIGSDLDDFIEKEKESLMHIEGASERSGTLGLEEEIIRYHAFYGPHRNASVVYCRESSQ